MDYERNKKYLCSKGAPYRYIGLGIMGAAIVAIIIGDMFVYMRLFAFGCIVAAAGAALAFIPAMGTADDAEIDGDVTVMFRDIAEKAIDELELRPKLMYLEPQQVSGYSYNGGKYIHVGKDGSWRTSECTCAQIVFTHLGICIIRLDFSLIEDKSEKRLFSFRFRITTKRNLSQINTILNTARKIKQQPLSALFSIKKAKRYTRFPAIRQAYSKYRLKTTSITPSRRNAE